MRASSRSGTFPNGITNELGRYATTISTVCTADSRLLDATEGSRYSDLGSHVREYDTG